VSTETESRWLSMGEAVAASGLSDDTIRRYISQGIVRGRRVGVRLVRVDATSLDALTVDITGPNR
jgi:predicted DNA-binding transcriptional regulator AlpA